MRNNAQLYFLNLGQSWRMTPPTRRDAHLPRLFAFVTVVDLVTILITNTSPALPSSLKTSQLILSLLTIVCIAALYRSYRLNAEHLPRFTVYLGYALLLLSATSAFLAPLLMHGNSDNDNGNDIDNDNDPEASDGLSWMRFFLLISISVARGVAGIIMVKTPTCVALSPAEMDHLRRQSSERLGTVMVRSVQSPQPIDPSTVAVASRRPLPNQVVETDSHFTEADWEAADADMLELGMTLSQHQTQPATPKPSLNAAERREKLNRMRQKHKTRKELHGEKAAACAICLDDMDGQSGGGNKVLECGHAFHNNCVLEWVDSRGRGGEAHCPICRHKIEKTRL